MVEVMAIPSRRGGVGGYRALWLKGEPLWAYWDPVLIAVARGVGDFRLCVWIHLSLVAMVRV